MDAAEPLPSCPESPTASSASTAADAANASNRFGFDLYGRLPKVDPSQPRGFNLIMSPASAEIALDMAATGARGETLTQMETVLHLRGLADAHAAFGSLLATINGRDGTEGMALHTAKRLWGQEGLPFESSFLCLLSQRYGAPLGRVDFVGATEAARLAINAWAATETHDRIQNVIPPGALTSDYRLVLASAVYFKGRWQAEFEPRATTTGQFATKSGPVEAKMMAQAHWFRYGHVDHEQVLELPYRGGLSMVVVLPDATDGLSGIEGRMRESYDRWLSSLKSAYVDLQLPRWKIESFMDLGAPLSAMGMSRAFSRVADFSGMTTSERLSIGFVIQKAFVETNERGTEAAAVTVIGMAYSSGIVPPPSVPFHADHPFLYFIRDPATGLVLFIGRVVDPS
jgi:serpin B